MRSWKEGWWTAWFYSGPYVPSGVLYGRECDVSHSRWLVPGFHPDPPIHAIDVYDREKHP